MGAGDGPWWPWGKCWHPWDLSGISLLCYDLLGHYWVNLVVWVCGSLSFLATVPPNRGGVQLPKVALEGSWPNATLTRYTPESVIDTYGRNSSSSEHVK